MVVTINRRRRLRVNGIGVALAAALLIVAGGCRRQDGSNGPAAQAAPRGASSPAAAPAPRSEAPTPSTPARPASHQVSSAKGPNLLVITIDTLRADHLGCYGYFRDTSPNIDKFAAESLVFEHCITPTGQTLPTHASLFTGVYPREHGLIANLTKVDGMQYKPSPILKTLATVMSEAGYQTAGFVSAEPVKAASGLGAGFQTWHEPDDKKVIAEETNKHVFAWLEGGMKQPFMTWVHYFDCHAKYEPPPPFDTMFQTDERLESFLREIGADASASKTRRPGVDVKVKETAEDVNAYDGEIRYVDQEVGRLFAKLAEVGVWDNTIVVLTGDHGEGLGQHGLPGHGDIWAEQLHVPLIIRVPGRKAARVEAQLSSVDILPTVLAVAPELPGSAFTAQTSGVNVLADGFDPVRPIYSQYPGTRTKDFSEAIFHNGWRYIKRDAKDENDQLFHVAEDPHELNDVADKYPEKVAELRAMLESLTTEQKLRGRQFKSGELVEMDAKRRENIKDLGYVEEDDDRIDDDTEGACCLSDGTCRPYTFAYCHHNEGKFHADKSCEDVACKPSP